LDQVEAEGMSIRVWISPPVQVDIGGGNLVWKAKAEQYCLQSVNRFPVNPDGSPASAWVITAGRNADWTAAQADTDLDDLFGGDLPASIDTVDALKSFLRSRTISQVPTARRNAINAVLAEYGVVTTDFNGATPLWRVWQRVCSTLDEQDFNYAGGFKF
jgi:hypothetical protein